MAFGASAAPVVTAIDGSQGWTEQNTAAGDSEIVDLSGQGGNLENNQPLPTGAVRQTTTGANADKSTVKLSGDFGTVADIFDQNLGFGYSFYKSSGSGNASAAPTLKLEFYNASYQGDGYGELIYEPYWQPNGTVNNPTPDMWMTEVIDLDTGLFWTTGMFGQPNGAGGAPFVTLADWESSFDAGFQGATLISVGIGIGSYNQDQLNYFDNVSISGTQGANGTYDFETPAAVPIPAGLPLLLTALGGVAALRRRKR